MIRQSVLVCLNQSETRPTVDPSVLQILIVHPTWSVSIKSAKIHVQHVVTKLSVMLLTTWSIVLVPMATLAILSLDVSKYHQVRLKP